jgi:small subunit ribosomal protein S27e
MKTIRDKKSNFVKVHCEKCKNEQPLFTKASSVVKCLVCGVELARPKGGKVELTDNAKVLEELE